MTSKWKMPARLAALAAAALSLAACANQSQTGEAAAVNKQVIYVTTVPDGASCELIREGKVIGTVEKTPDHISIERGKRPLMVVCKRDGYVEGAEVLAPRYTPTGGGGSVYVPNTAAGLAGGLIGLMMVSAIEASLSRNYTYPSASVSMVENRFDTVAARDAAFAEMAAKLKDQADKAQKASGGNCHPDDRDCQARPPEKNTELDLALQRLEQQKQAALIGPAKPTATPPVKATANPAGTGAGAVKKAAD